MPAAQACGRERHYVRLQVMVTSDATESATAIGHHEADLAVVRADLSGIDPDAVIDRATFADPHQLSAGVSEVLVNGKVTISSGTFTGELAGRALTGPGARR